MVTATLTKNILSAEGLPKVDYQIVHATAGHIRIRVPRLAEDEVYADRLDRAVKSFNFVTKAYINAKARSLVVNYRNNELSIVTVQKHLAIALERASTAPLAPHSTSTLAKRLGVSSQALTWHRSQTDFAEWSMAKDPDRVAWLYDRESKSFHPLESRFETTARGCSKEQQILLALTEATSGKVAGMLGKVAGGAIGLAVLGSAGLVLGEEIGGFVGEIIGSELAKFG